MTVVGQEVGLHAALDVGSSRVCCLAFIENAAELLILGAGLSASEGLTADGVRDPARAERSISRAITEAERMAGVRITKVTLGLSVRQVELRIFAASDGGDDARRLTPLHAFRETGGLREEVRSILVDADVLRSYAGVLREIDVALDTAKCATLAAAYGCSFAAAPRTMTCVIDLGAETTGVALLRESTPILIQNIPIGGRHVTSDLARGLSLKLESAERVKVLFGAAEATAHDDLDLIDLGVGAGRLPRSMLTGIIRPRFEEIFELVRNALDQEADLAYDQIRFVLVGGGSQMTGACAVARRVLGEEVAAGATASLPGLPSAVQGPSFASVAGLARLAAEDARRRRRGVEPTTSAGSLRSRLFRWRATRVAPPAQAGV